MLPCHLLCRCRGPLLSVLGPRAKYYAVSNWSCSILQSRNNRSRLSASKDSSFGTYARVSRHKSQEKSWQGIAFCARFNSSSSSTAWPAPGLRLRALQVSGSAFCSYRQDLEFRVSSARLRFRIERTFASQKPDNLTSSWEQNPC